MARKRPSEAESLAQLPATEERGRIAAAMESRAKAAYYDSALGRVTIELTNGCVFAFPPALAQGLGSATAEELATVEVMPGGESIYWECLDVGFSVPNLIAGSFGTKAWMGRVGGRVRSRAKTAAVRENGKKGGRPRKATCVDYIFTRRRKKGRRLSLRLRVSA